MNSSAPTAAAIVTRRTRSRHRRRKPSSARCRSRGVPVPAHGWRRARNAPAAAAIARKLAALTSSAGRGPSAASPAASSGPAAKPAYRAASRTPVAAVTPREPATAGTSENSAGWPNALPAVSSDESARIAARSLLLNANAEATSAWAAEATTSTRTPSTRSATSPASGASATMGTSVVANSADTARPLPVSSWTCNASTRRASRSPADERKTAPASRRRSRDTSVL
jgi:hypothetical protein